jgi:predicted TIM-barrel fold metal-dependent hydrolase
VITAIVDTDAHVTEVADLWTSRVSTKKWGDLVPHLELVDAPKTFEEAKALVYGEHLPKMQAWVTGDTTLAMAGASAYAGWHEPFPMHPPTIEEAHPAAHDATQRLALMDEQGIYAQGLYPNVGGFGSARFREMPEQELAFACVRAYNDYLYEWVSPARQRFILNAAIPYWNIAEAVREVERVAAMGFKSAIFSGAPQDHGLPFLADPHWNPLWSAVQSAGMVISFHLGSGNFLGRHFQWDRVKHETEADVLARLITMGFLDGASHVVDLLHSGVLRKFPDLKFVAAESGIGWIPFVLESADYHYAEATEGRMRDDLLPSERFQRQVYASFWFEEIAPSLLLDEIGTDNVIFETDFPHPSCLWPSERVAEVVDRLGSLPGDVSRKILQTNAAKLYGLDADLILAWETGRASS